MLGPSTSCNLASSRSAALAALRFRYVTSFQAHIFEHPYRISTTFSLTSGWSRNGTIAWYLGINPFMPWQSYVGELQINLPINGEKTNRRQTHASLDMCHADTDKCRRFREHHQTGIRKQMGTRDKRIRLMPMQSNQCVLVHDENKTIALLPAGENRTKEDGDRWLMINAALSF